ncbi:MAG: hypothetical protein RI947_1274, partial [Candidatus Parcubacteria bacterium]
MLLSKESHEGGAIAALDADTNYR